MYNLYGITQMVEDAGLGTNVVSYAATILLIVARWFLYLKAGEEGWASIIPFYNRYMLFKVSGKKHLFLPWLLCQIACMVAAFGCIIAVFIGMVGGINMGKSLTNAMFAGGVTGVLVCCLIVFGTAVAVLVFVILQCVGLTNEMGVSNGFAVGLILLPYIFYPILAFDKKYQFTKKQATAEAPYQNPYAQAENPYAQPVSPTVDYTVQPGDYVAPTEDTTAEDTTSSDDGNGQN